MKKTRLLMGMPITVEVLGRYDAALHRRNEIGIPEIIDAAFDYFVYVDNKFSVFKEDSEIMKINRGEISPENASADMREILELAEMTKNEADGYFDIVNRKGILDPSGIVKGWAIFNVAKLIAAAGFEDYYVDAGGDIQVSGRNSSGDIWSVGIKNPFNQREVVKVVYLTGEGVATSGTYIRGQHIYNPKKMSESMSDIVSLTVIGPNVYEADRFATPAFAMGLGGIEFIERLNGFEGYMIDSKGIATMTSGFERYTDHES